MIDRHLPDGTFAIAMDPAFRVGPQIVILGVHPETSPSVIARKAVREEMADVLAWLVKPPDMRTGQEIYDSLKESKP